MTDEVLEARRAGLSAAARTLTRRALGRRGGASAPAELRFRLPRRLRALRGATRGAQRDEPFTGSLRSRDGSLAGVLVLFAIAEVGEWRLPPKRKSGRGRVGGRTASSKRATATSEKDARRRTTAAKSWDRSRAREGFLDDGRHLGSNKPRLFHGDVVDAASAFCERQHGREPESGRARNATGMPEPSRRTWQR